MSEEREMIYTIRAELEPLNGARLMEWFDWAHPLGWAWVDIVDDYTEEERQVYELQTSALKVVQENIRKLFESRIEAQATDKEGDKVAAVWRDDTQEIEWNFFALKENEDETIKQG